VNLVDSSSLTMLCDNKDHLRSPPLSRLGTGTGAALHVYAMRSAAKVLPVADLTEE